MQELTVAIIVAAAALYAAWRLAPAAWRHGSARTLARLATRSGVPATTARRIEIRVATPAGGCGDCGPCKACSGGAPKPS